jgi:hypothetical protein
MDAIHWSSGEWNTMLHGFVNATAIDASGPRGDETFSTNMLMLGSFRDVFGAGRFGIRAMVSLEPTMGAEGYPLLLQTGETANGVDPLIDPRHYIPLEPPPPGAPPPPQPENVEAWLLESALEKGRHTLFMRGELLEKDELFPPSDIRVLDAHDVSQLTLGYVFDVLDASHLRLGVGVGGTLVDLTRELEPEYGESPEQAFAFLRLVLQ